MLSASLYDADDAQRRRRADAARRVRARRSTSCRRSATRPRSARRCSRSAATRPRPAQLARRQGHAARRDRGVRASSALERPAGDAEEAARDRDLSRSQRSSVRRCKVRARPRFRHCAARQAWLPDAPMIWFWLGFFALVALLLFLDLGVLHRKATSDVAQRAPRVDGRLDRARAVVLGRRLSDLREPLARRAPRRATRRATPTAATRRSRTSRRTCSSRRCRSTTSS